MSNFVFAMNPRLKNGTSGEIEKKYHRGYAEPATAEQVMDMMFGGVGNVKATVEAIRQGQEELKDTLPFLCPHYAQFRGNHRAQDAIMPEEFTFKTCIDVDDKELVGKAIERALEVNDNPFSDFDGKVEYIEYSARKKAHIWIRLPQGMTVAEAQQAFCEEIGVPYDESCITPERFIYMTGDEVYRSERWLQPLTDEEVEAQRKAYAERGLDMDGCVATDKGTRAYAGAKNVKRMAARPSADAAKGMAGEADDKAKADAGAKAGEEADIVAANKRTRLIVQEIMEKEKLSATDFNKPGGRHNAVKMLLDHAIQLMTEGELLGALSEVMPQNWQDPNIRQLVKDFYTKYYDKSAKLTVFQKEVYRKCRKLEEETDDSPSAPPTPIMKAEGDTAPLTEIYANQQPPSLPSRLPRLVRLVTSKTPAEMQATVAQGMFPPLGVYPRKLRFLYIDNQFRELRANCLTIGGTGTGKDTCLKQPILHITTPMVERDNINRQRLKEYNEEYNSTKANKDKPKRPDDLIIQKVGSDLTPARLAQLMDDSQGAFLYTHLHEFEQWYGIEGLRGHMCTFKNLKLADDEDNPFGQERAGVQSVNYTGPLGLNWNASTTPNKVQEMFRHVMVDGPVSRLCLATTPDVGLAAPMPRYGNYDEKYDDALAPYIERLQAATGDIVCRQAMKMAEKLKQECDDYTLLTQDEVFDNLSHRALVHAFRKACLLYAANGMKWENAIEGFCRWSLHYDLWLKLHFFGDKIRESNGKMQPSKRGPRNLLEQIPANAEGEFTLSDAIAVRIKNGMSEAGARNMLSQWKSRGYIEEVGAGTFRKVNSEHESGDGKRG